MTRKARTMTPRTLARIAEDDPIRVALVVSKYHEWITTPMREGAIEAFNRLMGKAAGEVILMEAPGAFELPVVVSEAANSELYHAVVAIGCVIKGETQHDIYINHAVSDAIMRISLETGVPVGFGILTVDNAQQAEARAGGAMGNKGAEAMEAALSTLAVLDAIRGEVERADDNDDDDEDD